MKFRRIAVVKARARRAMRLHRRQNRRVTRADLRRVGMEAAAEDGVDFEHTSGIVANTDVADLLRAIDEFAEILVSE